ncbi:hypothetical protein AURDEDRAFT_167680 [Auricularia subglabra TFB-10046 SS5]|nr:hypothetical protein AURDEDRAFT_167680 [Auricularia subglabra TFB-10046 SS5]
MNVIEAPAMNSQCLLPGTIAIVSVDPVASVAGLRDEQATREASLLPRGGKYLAVVETYMGFDLRKPIYDNPLGVSFFCIGRGLPEAASCSVGLSAEAPSVNDRSPLVVSPPLPWPDCCVYTLKSFYGTIARVFPFQSPGSATIVTEDQLSKIVWFNIQDSMSEQVPLQDAYGEPIETPADGEDFATFDLEWCLNMDVCSVRRGTLREDGSNAPGNTDDLNDSDEDESHECVSCNSRLAWPQFEVTLDLTSVNEFSQPAELMYVLRQLTIIEHEYTLRRVERMSRNRPRAVEWVQTIAASHVDSCGERVTKDTERAQDDALAGPEEAPKHRIGQKEPIRGTFRIFDHAVNIQIAN